MYAATALKTKSLSDETTSHICAFKEGKNTVTHLIRVLVFHLKALVFPTTEMQRGRNERLLVSVPLSAGACALLAFLCVCVLLSLEVMMACWRNRMPYHSSLFYLTSFKTAEQYVGEIVRMDEEGEWENAEVGG